MMPLVAFSILLFTPFAQDAEWDRQEPEFRRIAESLQKSPNPYIGKTELMRLESAVKNPKLRIARRAALEARLAFELLKVGEIDRAVQLLEDSWRASQGRMTPEEAKGRLELLGLAYLRQAETRNCVSRHGTESCIFPLEGGAVHVEREPAEKARAAFEQVMEMAPDDLASRWILNLIVMALGEYPDGVPEEHRIPPSAFASDFDIGRFEDVAPDAGVDTLNLCGGVIADDFDGDGLIDILTSTYDPTGALTFYVNQGDGSFADLSEASRSSDQLGGLNLIGGDYDNDGDIDVYMMRGAWLFGEGRIRNTLLRNDDAIFVDMTRAAGVAEPACPTQTAVFADLDDDGHLDLYVGNESLVDIQPSADYPSQYFRNLGDGTFRDVAAKARVENDRYCKSIAAGDYDNDGDVDLYLSNIGFNRLFRNEGDGTFRDVAEELAVTGPAPRSFVSWFFDVENDGWLDLYVASYDATLADLTAEVLELEHSGKYPRLYHNLGGTFEDVASKSGLGRVVLPMGANFGDLDHDGFLDIYLTTGEPKLKSLMPNLMLRNAGDGRFQDVTTSGGFGHLQKGHGVAFVDFDHDGDQDIYHQLGGFFPVDRYQNVLFKNPGHGNHWLYVKLVGTKTNRGAVGARIKVVVATEDGEREIHRAVGAVSSFGGSPSRQEIGLGQATSVKRLEILWPTSASLQVFEDVPLDAMLRVTEGEDSYERVELKRFEFD